MPVPSPGIRQLGVAVRAPAEPGWSRVKSDEGEIRFEKASAAEPALAGSRTLAGSTFGGGGELLARLETWKESQVATAPGRKRDSLHFYRVEFKGRTCLQYDGSSEDVAASQGGFTRFNFMGFLCPLDGTGETVAEIEMSSRSQRKGFSDELNRSSQEFFAAAVFTEGP